MKTFKLWIHQKTQKNFSSVDLAINTKTLTNVNIGDVVEIYHPEDNYSRLLLQVTSLPEDFQQKDTISVEQSIANAFQLRTYQDVIVNVVDTKSVELDLVELTFKEQYFSRTDMWRLSKMLINTCVYKGKKVQFAEMRAQVYEMWAKGDCMACGLFTANTKVVFRSSTAVVTIFLQMSSEMWEFDAHGDLYYEKAVGFLQELFTIWKDKNCCHDVTIVMFSRTFYDAISIEDFPLKTRECIQQDHEGRFYEDFYRVVVQNERYEDWSSTLIELKKLFVEYRNKVLMYHNARNLRMPKAWNSTAAQGNFLEVINMSLNAYDKYYLDRNFDRTGKVSLVINPGAGVFEVDRELTNITKQRVIDYGIGMDIVCMAEQPLHAVPLFRFHSKTKHDITMDVGDDYNLPHWINASFYYSRSQVQTSSNTQFIPRIKLGIKTPNKNLRDRRESSNLMHVTSAVQLPVPDSSSDNFPFTDYDEYDAQVFKAPSNKNIGWKLRATTAKVPKSFTEALKNLQPRVRHASDNYHCFVDHTVASTNSLVIPSSSLSKETSQSNSLEQNHRVSSHESLESTESDESIGMRFVVGSDSSIGGQFISQVHKGIRPHRALINPFAPMRMNFKVTSNRRRWIHAFPVGPQGTAIQPHHSHSRKDSEKVLGKTVLSPTKEVVQAAQLAVEARKNRTRQESTERDPRSRSPTLAHSDSNSSTITLTSSCGSRPSTVIQPNDSTTSLSSMVQGISEHPLNRGRPAAHGKRMAALLKEMELTRGSWLGGPTGEQDWSPTLTTGVDWKSMTVPALLPTTTDYFPDQETLQKYYVYTEYSLLPDDFNSDSEFFQAIKQGEEDSKYQHKPLTTVEVFKELISQRLAQGFQLVTIPKVHHATGSSQSTTLSSSPHLQTSSLMRARSRSEQSEEYLLSIGRIFHRVNLTGPNITVTQYRPRHPSPQLFVHYRYRLYVPDSTNYDISWTDFCNERLEHYNWNYLDHYICTRGENDFGLMESLKYWRSKFFLLPQSLAATKRIHEASENPDFCCDIYEEKTIHEQLQLVDGCLRYLESINKIRRPTSNRRPKMRSVGSQSSVNSASMSDDENKRRRSLEGISPHSRKRALVYNRALLRRNSEPEGPSGFLSQKQSTVNPEQRNHHPASIPSLPHAETAENKSDIHPFTGEQFRVRHPSMPNPIRVNVGAESCDPIPSPLTPGPSFNSITHPSFEPRKTASIQSNVISQSTNEIASVTMSYATDTPSRPTASSSENNFFEERLSTCSSLEEIIEAMLDTHDGLCFIPAQPGLPQYSFIAGEAINWICCYVDGVETSDVAVSLLQQMINEKLICHGSNSIEHPFINGFLLYYIIKDKKKELKFNTCFQDEWCEVAFNFDESPPEHEIPPFLLTDLPMPIPGKTKAKDLLNRRMPGRDPGKMRIKQVNVDVDPSGKSNRDEWAIAQYHSHYSPTSPFSLEVQWIVATGAILAELVYSWVRKASSCGFHFVPVPLDQYALPYTPNSDPLRGPVFIPLNVCCLTDGPDQQLFDDFPKETTSKRIILFQDSILKRFGFLRDLYSVSRSAPWGFLENEMRYVHCTGGMFALIPDTASDVTRAETPFGRTRASRTQSLHKEFVSRQLANCDNPVGFIWSWNFMLSKRWRSHCTGDETFPDKLIADFRKFCSNRDNRLKEYWDSCKAKAAEEYTKLCNKDKSEYDMDSDHSAETDQFSDTGAIPDSNIVE